MNEIIEFFFIGYAGEKNARRKPIDISDLQTRWPEATPILMVNRPKESAPYPATITVEGSVLYWEVAEIDVAKSGFGQAQVFMRDGDGNVLGKSAVMNTLIKTSLNGTEQENPPPALETWIAKFLEAYEGMGGGNNSGGSSVSIDATLTQPGKAADAKATGDALNELKEANEQQDEAIAQKLNASELPTAINTALAQAKESGEFKGDKGDKGDTGDAGPQGPAGSDYVLTEADKEEIAEMAAEKVEVPEGGGAGGEMIEAIPTASNILASGTIPAGVTSANLGAGYVDTGLTLGDLRKYKCWGYSMRLDDSKPYIAVMIGWQKICYLVTNGAGAFYTWVDNAKTLAACAVCGTGNTNAWGNNPLGTLLNIHSSNNGMPQLINQNDDAKVYIGIMHMNGLSATTKDMMWSVQAFAKYGE